MVMLRYVDTHEWVHICCCWCRHALDLLEQGHEQKECLYWLALTFYGLGEYRASRSHCERLIRMEPTHAKALALHDCIKEVLSKGTLFTRQFSLHFGCQVTYCL